jgi:hypothetical protein
MPGLVSWRNDSEEAGWSASARISKLDNSGSQGTGFRNRQVHVLLPKRSCQVIGGFNRKTSSGNSSEAYYKITALNYGAIYDSDRFGDLVPGD